MSRPAADFETTQRFRPFSSKFDAFLRGEAALDATEERGFALFKDPERGNCIACHFGVEESIEPSDWLFTDFTYDNLGVPRNSLIPSDDLYSLRNSRRRSCRPEGR